MPCSMARSMIWCESSSLVCGPKFIVPRTRRETDKPVRPRCVYSMFVTLRPVRVAPIKCTKAAGQEPGGLRGWCWVLALALVVRNEDVQSRRVHPAGRPRLAEVVDVGALRLR